MMKGQKMEGPTVTSPKCNCDFCVVAYHASAEEKEKFGWRSVALDFKFPVFYDPRGEDGVSYVGLVKILETEAMTNEDLEDVISFLTYFDVDKNPLNLRDYIRVAELLFAQDLEPVIKERRMALDFLAKMTRLFVVAWYAVTVHQNKTAMWAACRLRRLLLYIVQFPVISCEVALIFFTVEKWPVMGPVQIIERLTKDHLFCTDTLSLLANLTRISNVSNLLARDTRCIEVIQEQFSKCCGCIQNHDERGNLLLMLFMNLALNDDFLGFLIKHKDSYFMTVILLDFIKHSKNEERTGITIWLFLRNVSMKDEGNTLMTDNLRLYLGHILYPIAGPEELTEDEKKSLPIEVCYLNATKNRVADRTVRACILDILCNLCRREKGLIKLREYQVHTILKYYQLAEENEVLKEKIEKLANILIRHEGTEVGVDDIIEGLALSPSTDELEPASGLCSTKSTSTTDIDLD